jgi:hypothetical protein
LPACCPSSRSQTVKGAGWRALRTCGPGGPPRRGGPGTAELVDAAEGLDGSVHYLDVLGVLDRERHAATHPDAVASNPAWVAHYGTGVGLLAAMADDLGITEHQFVTEARRQAVEAMDCRPQHARHHVAALIEELDEWLARHDAERPNLSSRM